MEGFSIHLSIRGGVTKEVLDRFLSTAQQQGLQLSPDDDPRLVSYKGNSTDREWAELDHTEAVSRFLTDDQGTFKITEPELPIRYTTTSYKNQINLSIYQNYWRDGFEDTETITESIIDLVSSLHLSLPCYHTRSMIRPIREFEATREKERNDEWVYETTDKISWLVIFGEEGVDRHGRKELLSAPVWRVEELDPNNILILLSRNPADPQELGERYNALRSHLNLDHLPEAT